MDIQGAVLGLVVEEPRFGYQVTKELGLNSPAPVYRALERLVQQGHVEPVDLALPELGKRPRVWYQATATGRAAHSRRTARQAARLLHERESAMATLANATPDDFSAVLDEYERQLLQDLAAEPDGDGLIAELVAEEKRLVNDARRRWVAYVRRRIADGLVDA